MLGTGQGAAGVSVGNGESRVGNKPWPCRDLQYLCQELPAPVHFSHSQIFMTVNALNPEEPEPDTQQTLHPAEL